MQQDVYHYTQSAGAVQKNTVLRKTYGLLGLSFIPFAIGAFISMSNAINLYSLLGGGWKSFIAIIVFFYGMMFVIEKNRYSNIGAVLLQVLTFGMGFLIAPMLSYGLHFSNGPQLIGIAGAMTAGAFFTMATLARRTKADMSKLANFLFVGGVILMIGIVANLFLNLPALSLTISAGFVIFSSLMIMLQVRTIIDGGETSHISAALTLFISLYNIFSSLLNILFSIAGDD